MYHTTAQRIKALGSWGAAIAVSGLLGVGVVHVIGRPANVTAPVAAPASTTAPTTAAALASSTSAPIAGTVLSVSPTTIQIRTPAGVVHTYTRTRATVILYGAQRVGYAAVRVGERVLVVTVTTTSPVAGVISVLPGYGDDGGGDH
jgi:hypothetical protein